MAVQVQNPWAIFTAGGPGSGKGYCLARLKKLGVIPHTAVHDDMDYFQTCLAAQKEDPNQPKLQKTVDGQNSFKLKEI